MEKQFFKLGHYGNIEIKKPLSLGVCFEFTSLWASELDQAQLARLCAGAICACSEDSKLPLYRPEKTNVLEFGFKAMERILGAGVFPNQIFEIGSVALLVMAQALPTEPEVEEAVNFTTEAKEAD